MASPIPPDATSAVNQAVNEGPSQSQTAAPTDPPTTAPRADTDMNLEEDADGADQDLDPNVAKDVTMEDSTEVPAILESRIPAKKDATLREFLGKMDDYAPIVCTPEYQAGPLLMPMRRYPMP